MQRSKVDIDTETEGRLKEVRKEVWKGGLKGVVIGGILGGAGHCAVVKFFPQASKKLNRNTLMATILLATAVGSFLGSVVNGKNSVQYIGDIFKRGSNSASTYQNQLNKNEQELIESFDESFKRREEAIRNSLQNRKDSN